MNTIRTTSNVTFTSIATILIPLGVGMLQADVWVGLTSIVLGILSLVAREFFKVTE
jgi:hypothetical protein